MLLARLECCVAYVLEVNWMEYGFSLYKSKIQHEPRSIYEHTIKSSV